MDHDTLPDLEFRLADLDDRFLFETLASWHRDPEIRANLTPNPHEQDLPLPTAEQLMAGYRRQNKLVWFIFSKDSMIGEVTLDPDFHGLMHQVAKSAWISIVIGDRSCWGQGVGTAAMRFLEETARRIGMCRIELGVFSFNQRALALYQKMGYRVIGITPHFTWSNGDWHADIRLEKWLEPGH